MHCSMSQHPQHAPDLDLIALQGSLNATGTGEVEGPLLGHAAACPGHLALDLSDVDFLASIGLRLLLQMAKTLARRERQLVLLAPPPLVAQVLEAAAMDRLVPVAADIDTARRFLQS